MRIAACVVGMLGGFFGIYFGQLLVTAIALLGIVASAFGGNADSSSPLYFGLLALVFYTIGVSGGVIALVRPGIASALMVLAAFGGLAATIAVGPATASLFPQATSTQTPRPFVTLVPAITQRPTPATAPNRAAILIVSFPFAGPVLLIVASALAGIAAVAERTTRSPSAPVDQHVIARRGELATMALLFSGPVPSARSSRGEIPAGTQVDVLEQQGGFVHVRGTGFEGYLPATAVRLL